MSERKGYRDAVERMTERLSHYMPAEQARQKAEDAARRNDRRGLVKREKSEKGGQREE
ncbi:MAG: hypothetical protein ABII82_13435 [Verrucomicrobiota bacterium]